MIRVILFEDNDSLRKSLSKVLSATEDIQFVGAFADANDAVSRMYTHRPDVVLMDIQMPGISGIEAMQNIKAVFKDAKVLIQTVFEDDHRIFSAICGGASGYVLKEPDTDILIKAIFDVNGGGTVLTPQIAQKVVSMFQSQFVTKQTVFVALTDKEKEVLTAMVNGMSYKMIADNLSISLNTARFHVRNIYEKLHVNSASEAVRKAIESRLI